MSRVCALGGWSVGAGGVLIACQSGVADALCRVASAPGPGVDLVLPGDEAALLLTLDEALAPERGRVVAVGGLSGGAGTSTIAAALAWRLGGVLVDADPLGPGATALVGIAAPHVVTDTAEVLGRGALAALPSWGPVAVVRAAPPATAAAVAALSRVSPWVVCDVGRASLECADVDVAVGRAGVADAQAWAARKRRGVLVVTGPGAGGVPGVRLRSLRAPARASAAGWGPRPSCSRAFARAIGRIAGQVQRCSA